MAKVPLLSQTPANSIAASTTQTFVVANGLGTGGAPTVEASQQITYRKSGVISNIWIKILTNDRAASTFRSRINGANGAQVVSITGSTTGDFEDTVNTDTVVPGDEVNASLVTGAGGSTFTFGARDTLFLATRDTTTILFCGSGNVLNVASSTTFGQLVGIYGAGNATEAYTQHSFRNGGVLSDFAVGIRTNDRSDTSTTRIRVNGANGNQVVSIPAATTGVIEDNVNTDTIASGDEVDTSTVLGAGTGGLRYYSTSVFYTSTNNKIPVVTGNTGGVAYLAGTTYYPAWGSFTITNTVEASHAYELNVSMVSSNFACYLSTNTVVGDSTVQLRKNAADANAVITVGGLTSGYFEDATNIDSFISTDEIGIELVGGVAGTSAEFHEFSLLGMFPGRDSLLLLGVT